MPKRYTDAEVNTIVKESQELREYIKAMITNQQDYVTEMKGMRERNADLTTQVTDLKKELVDQQNSFIEILNKKAENMESTVNGIRPELDWIRNEAQRTRSSNLEPHNSMWLLNMLRASHPDYIRDLTLILVRGERMHRRGDRDDRRFMVETTPYDFDINWLDEVKRSMPINFDITSIEESMKNLSADNAKLNPIIAEEPRPITANDIRMAGEKLIEKKSNKKF